MYLVQIHKLCVFTVHFWTKFIQYECKVHDKTIFFQFWNILLRSQTATLTPFGNTVPGGLRTISAGTTLLVHNVFHFSAGNDPFRFVIHGILLPIVALCGVICNLTSIFIFTRREMRTPINLILTGKPLQ